MARFRRAEQDGFTVCIIDTDENEHCFRIDKELGAHICTTLNKVEADRQFDQPHHGHEPE